MQQFPLTGAKQIMLLNFNGGHGLSTHWTFMLREVAALKDILCFELLAQTKGIY